MNLLLTASHEANLSSPLNYFLSFGLGVAVMAVAIWWLAGQIKEAKAKEDALQKNLLDLTRESLSTIQNLTKVVEAISPALAANSRETESKLDEIVGSLKAHIDTHFKLLNLIKRE